MDAFFWPTMSLSSVMGKVDGKNSEYPSFLLLGLRLTIFCSAFSVAALHSACPLQLHQQQQQQRHCCLLHVGAFPGYLENGQSVRGGGAKKCEQHERSQLEQHLHRQAETGRACPPVQRFQCQRLQIESFIVSIAAFHALCICRLLCFAKISLSR